MPGTMGNFYIGVSGLQSNQYAMNTTAHNIQNADTPGYSRQQVILSDIGYVNINMSAKQGWNQEGQGTKIADVRLVRDRLVDRSYRTEFGREQFYQTKFNVLSETERFFGEMDNSSFRTYMQDLWSSAQELQKESNSIVTRSSYIATAVTFVEQANQIYDQLTTYQMNLNKEIEDQVKRINEIAEEIYKLNQKIGKVEGGGIESANDLRDQRDVLLDELSGIVTVSFVELDGGQVDVYAEGRPLVTLGGTFEMEVRQISESCEYEIPIWSIDKEDVFNLYYAPNAEDKTDTGSLKGVILSRGDWVAKYTDIPVAPEAPVRPVRGNYGTTKEYNQAMADYATDYEKYQNEYAEFTKQKEYYNTYLEPYTVNNMIAQFDRLIHGIVTKVNDILCPNKELEITDAYGNISTIRVLDEEKAGYGMGETNFVQGTELFKRFTVDRYTEQEVTLADGSPKKVQVYNEESAENFFSLYTLGNIEVNDALLKNPSLMPLTNTMNEELQGVADQLIHMWDEDFGSIGPNSLVVSNFMGYYKDMVGDFSNKGQMYEGIAESQNKAVQELEIQRQTVVGVSTDEELSNLIKFQQGFNASSRYFTVVSEMVEHLLNKLG